MEFIISVFGASLIIMFVVIFWIIASFFTMKNVYHKEYDSIKRCGFKDEWEQDDEGMYRLIVYDVHKILTIFASFFFPFVFMHLILLFMSKLLFKSFRHVAKFLDKVIPRVKVEIKENA